MSRKEIKIHLKKGERTFLRDFLQKGDAKARSIARANILLMADNSMSTEDIAEASGVHRQRIWRTKTRYLEEGIDSTLSEKPRSGQPRKYTDKHEAEIIALACTSPPKGRKRWTVRLLAERMKKKQGCDTINRESVRLVLKKRGRSLG